MNDMLAGISPWSPSTQFSHQKEKINSSQPVKGNSINPMTTDQIELSKEAKAFKEAFALIKEVGIVEFAKITQAVNQIQRGLAKALGSCPAYKNKIQEMIDSYENKMPRSVTEAFARLNKMLKESKLPQEVIDTIIRCIKEEMNHSAESKIYDSTMNLV